MWNRHCFKHSHRQQWGQENPRCSYPCSLNWSDLRSVWRWLHLHPRLRTLPRNRSNRDAHMDATKVRKTQENNVKLGRIQSKKLGADALHANGFESLCSANHPLCVRGAFKREALTFKYKTVHFSFWVHVAKDCPWEGQFATSMWGGCNAHTHTHTHTHTQLKPI